MSEHQNDNIFQAVKICHGCKIEKKISEFTTQSSGKIYSRCKKCRSEAFRIRYKTDVDFRYRVQSRSRKKHGSKLEGPITERVNPTCKIIREHHENMAGDPEHLSTEFIQKLLGRKCDV